MAGTLAAAAGGKINTLQACRAMAACMVVLSHTSVSIFSRPRYWPANPVGSHLDFGQIGVQFFFVLSGFIILRIHWPDLGRPARALNFLRKRVTRIYPIYWVVLGALMVVYFLVPNFGEGFERDPDIIASSALLVGGLRLSDSLKPITILPAAWTLYYEVAFYAVFLTLILSRRVGAVVLAAWFALSALDLLIGPFSGPAALYLSPYNLLFLMGMTAAWLLGRRTIPYPALMAILGFVLFLGAGQIELVPTILSEQQQSLLCGLGSMAAILGLVELERSHGLRTPAILVLLGEASYAIYLVHLSVLVLMAKVVSAVPMRAVLPLGVWYALFVVVAIGGGLMFHLVVERPLLRWVNRLSHGRKGRLLPTESPLS